MPVDVAAAGVDMHLAARSGDVRVVRSLVRRPGTDMDARDILGDTALLKAARYGHTEVVEELLAAGADPNAQDNNGWASLHVSIANNREEVFFTLLSGGGHQSAPVDIEAANSNGDTALHVASYHGQKWAVDTLLRLGANPRAINNKDQQPLQVARHNNVRSMLQSSLAASGRGEAAAVSARRVEEEGGRADERFGGEGVGRRSSDAGPPHKDTRRRHRKEDENQHGDEQPPTSESRDGVADNGFLDRLAGGSLVSSLETTEIEEEGDNDLPEQQEGDISFEEGSSEGELSQDSWEAFGAGH